MLNTYLRITLLFWRLKSVYVNNTYFSEPPEGGLDLVTNRQGAI